MKKILCIAWLLLLGVQGAMYAQDAFAIAEALLENTGVGYPKSSSSVRTALQEAINGGDATALQTAIANFKSSTDIQMPEDGKAYRIVGVQPTNDFCFYMDASGLKLTTEERTSNDAIFICEQKGSKYAFKNVETGAYLINKSNSGGYNGNSGHLAEYDATYCDFSIYSGNTINHEKAFGSVAIVGKVSTTGTYSPFTINPSGGMNKYSRNDGAAPMLQINSSWSTVNRLIEVPISTTAIDFISLENIGSDYVCIVTDQADGKVLTEKSNAVYLETYEEGNDQQLWKITASGTQYTICNKATGRYIDRQTDTRTSAMPTNASSRAYNISSAASSTDKRPLYNFFHPNTTTNCLSYDGTSNALQVATLVANTEGYAFSFYKPEGSVAPTMTLNEILAANHGLVRLGSNRSIAKVAVNNDDKMTMAIGDNEGTTTPAQIWLIEAKDGGGYTLRSMSNGKYMQNITTNNTSYPLGDEGVTVYIQESNEAKGLFVISTTSTFDDYTCLHHDGSDRVVRWHSSSLESAWNLKPATDANYEEMMEALNPTTPPTPPVELNRLEEILNTNNGLVRMHATIARASVDYVATQNGEVMKGAALVATSNAQIWQIQALDGGGYTLRSMSTGKYVGGPISAGATVGLVNEGATLYITDSEVTGYTDNFVISSSADFADGTCLYFDGSGLDVTGGNKSTQSGTWNIEAATDVNIEDMLSNDKYYKVKNVYHTDNYITESWLNRNMSGAATGNPATQCWKFTEIDGKITIQSVSSKLYIQADPGQSGIFQLGTEPAYFEVTQGTDANGSVNYSICHVAGGGRGLHQSASQNNSIVSWSATDGASRWLLEEQSLTAKQLASYEEQYRSEYGQYASEATSTDFLAFFADAAATQLKNEYKSMSDGQLRTAMSALPTELQDIAIKVKNDDFAYNGWEKHFRVAKYGAFSDAAYWAGQLRTNQYGSINNPTGIVANNGGKVFIIVGSDIPADATLKVETRCTANVPSCNNSGIVPQVISLKKGLNYLRCENDGSQIYISYISKDGDPIANYPELDIHVEGGSVQGYVDIKKHTDADWVSMNSAGLFRADDGLNLLGNYAQLYIKTAAASKNGNSIIPLIEIYDWYVYTELDLIGITAAPAELKDLPGADAYEDIYPKKVNNRLLCVGIGNGQIHGGNGHICLGTDGGASFYYEGIKVPGSNVWGAAHEYGHVNQGAINLIACTERSNNLFANVVVYKSGNCTSRGDNLKLMQSYMANGTHSWLEVLGKDTFHAAQMWYQLYLYYHAAGNDPFFYQKLFHLLRQDPINGANGNRLGTEDYLHFALKACEAANEDLTSFFEYWGFFEPVDNMHVTEYGRDHYLTTTQNQIDGVKSDMAKYSKKCNAALMFIEDRAVASYKESDNNQQKEYFGVSVDACATDLPGAQYSAFTGAESNPQKMGYTRSGNNITLQNSTGAAGVKFYGANGKLVYVASSDNIVIPSTITFAKAEAALTDGTTIPLHNTADNDLYLLNVYDVDGSNSVCYVNANDGAMLPEMRKDNAIAVLTEVNGSVPNNAPVSLSQADNVAVGTSFHHINLSDKYDYGFANATSYTAESITYSDRKLLNGWNTACFPFAISTTDLGEGAKIEILDTERTKDETLYFTSVEEVEAGVPCLIYVPEVIENWTFRKSNVNASIVGQPVVNTNTTFYMNGSFTEKNIGVGNYKMNSAGDAFGATSAEGRTSPFRAYVSAGSPSAAQSLDVKHVDGEVTGIEAPTSGTEQGAQLYDLQGRKVAVPRRGEIYILGGAKIMFK